MSSMIFSSFLFLTLALVSFFVFSSAIHSKTTPLFPPKYAVIFTYRSAKNDTKFGASVALAPFQGKVGVNTPPKGWVFIGAPTGRNHKGLKSGVLWRCGIWKGEDSTSCKKITLDSYTKDTSDHGRPVSEDFQGMWTGGSLEVSSGSLVTCGHRYLRGDRTIMNGLCYFFRENSTASSFLEEGGPTLSPNSSNRLVPFFSREQGFLKDETFTQPGINRPILEWKFGEAGISVHIPQGKRDLRPEISWSLHIPKAGEVLLGAPGVREYAGAAVRYIDKIKPRSGPSTRLNRNNESLFSEFVVANRGDKSGSHWMDYFGYSLSSGNYFQKSDLLYAGGAPRANDLEGEVVTFTISEENDIEGVDNKRRIQEKLVIKNPEHFSGSYFGSVLSSVDIDGDGRHELLVGAPMSSTNSTEHGKVFVFFFHENENKIAKTFSLLPQILKEGARFGSAVSYISYNNGQQTGPNIYILVGAAYENEGQGALYVFQYTGNAFLQIQRITGSDFHADFHGFGISISLPSDIDDNGTPDIAVGAFQSEQAAVLRTEPQISVTLISLLIFLGDSRNFRQNMIIDEVPRTYTLLPKIMIERVLGSGDFEIDIIVALKLDNRFKIQNATNLEQSLTNVKLKNGFNTSSMALEEIAIIISEMDDTESLTDFKFELTLSPKTDVGVTVKVPEYIITSENEKFSGNGKVLSIPLSPFPVRKNLSSIPVIPLCEDDNHLCTPQLTIIGEWLSFKDDEPLDTDTDNVTVLNLGSFENVRFKITILNTGDPAVRPRFRIEWALNGVNVGETTGTDQQALLHRRNICNRTIDEKAILYDCQLKDIRKNRKQEIDIPFNFERYYAEKRQMNFTVGYSIVQEGRGRDHTTNSSTIRLVTESKIVVKGRNDNFSLSDASPSRYSSGGPQLADKSGKSYLSWKQSFLVTLTGKPGALVFLNFSFPIGDFIKVTPDRNSSIQCEQEPKILDPVDVPIHETPDNVPSVITAEAEGLSKESSFLTIECGREDLSGWKLKCHEFKCNVMMKAGEYVDIDFEIEIAKTELDELLEKTSKRNFQFFSRGIAVIFNGEDNPDSTSSDNSVTHFVPKIIESVPAWVYIVSILCGILILGLMIFILYKCGFFKRETKKKLKVLVAEEEEARKSQSVPPMQELEIEDAELDDGGNEEMVQTKMESKDS